jgi:hypothetical protein
MSLPFGNTSVINLCYYNEMLEEISFIREKVNLAHSFGALSPHSTAQACESYFLSVSPHSVNGNGGELMSWQNAHIWTRRRERTSPGFRNFFKPYPQ